MPQYAEQSWVIVREPTRRPQNRTAILAARHEHLSAAYLSYGSDLRVGPALVNALQVFDPALLEHQATGAFLEKLHPMWKDDPWVRPHAWPAVGLWRSFWVKPIEDCSSMTEIEGYHISSRKKEIIREWVPGDRVERGDFILLAEDVGATPEWTCMGAGVPIPLLGTVDPDEIDKLYDPETLLCIDVQGPASRLKATARAARDRETAHPFPPLPARLLSGILRGHGPVNLIRGLARALGRSVQRSVDALDGSSPPPPGGSEVYAEHLGQLLEEGASVLALDPPRSLDLDAWPEEWEQRAPAPSEEAE